MGKSRGREEHGADEFKLHLSTNTTAMVLSQPLWPRWRVLAKMQLTSAIAHCFPKPGGTSRERRGKLLLECSGATRKHKCHSFGSMSELFPVGAPLGVHNSLYRASVSYPFPLTACFWEFLQMDKGMQESEFPLQSHTAHTLALFPQQS